MDSPSTRPLDPYMAFMMSLVGLGYMYVGWFWLGPALSAGMLLIFGVIGWTGWIFEPAGIWLVFGLIAFIGLPLWMWPVVIAARRKEAPTRFYNRWYWYVAWLVAAGLLGELLIPQISRITGFQVFSIPSDSMLPTLDKGDWIAVDIRRYRKQEPRVGELVAFEREGGSLFVKRIVGVPGDRVEVRNGGVIRNGRGEDEPYLHAQLEERLEFRDSPAVTLGPDQFYVLGDFRDQSRDSRYFGPIARHQLIGRTETLCFSYRGGIRWDRFHRDLAGGLKVERSGAQ